MYVPRPGNLPLAKVINHLSTIHEQPAAAFHDATPRPRCPGQIHRWRGRQSPHHLQCHAIIGEKFDLPHGSPRMESAPLDSFHVSSRRRPPFRTRAGDAPGSAGGVACAPSRPRWDVLRCHSRAGGALSRHHRTRRSDGALDRNGPRPFGTRHRARSAGAIRFTGHPGARTVLESAGGAGRAERRSRRRLPGRPGGVLTAAGPRRKGVFVSA